MNLIQIVETQNIILPPKAVAHIHDRQGVVLATYKAAVQIPLPPSSDTELYFTPERDF